MSLKGRSEPIVIGRGPANYGRSSARSDGHSSVGSAQTPDLRSRDNVDRTPAFKGICLVLLNPTDYALSDARPCRHLARAS
jgi:hypothetical protein